MAVHCYNEHPLTNDSDWCFVLREKCFWNTTSGRHVIALTSHERFAVSNHHVLDYSFPTTSKRKRNHGSSTVLAVGVEDLAAQPCKNPVMRGMFPWHEVLMVTSHYNDVIMGAIASQITTIVYSTVYSDADQRKHQSSASLVFVWGIHRGPVNSPHRWPVTRKMFPFDDVIMYNTTLTIACYIWWWVVNHGMALQFIVITL